MTATIAPPGSPSGTLDPSGPGPDATWTRRRIGWWLRDCAVMTRRNLLHVRREPMQLSDVTVQPVLFTVLFVYIFGAAMVLPGGGNVKAFLIPGLLALNLTTSATGTAVGLSSDLQTGVIDRLRTLPMTPSSVLLGRSAADLLSAALCTTFVLLTGWAVGWAPRSGPLSTAAGIGVALLFAWSVSWACGCVGLRSSDPESAQALAFLVLFPLAFVSNAFAPTQAMPTVLATIANWNPVSALTAALRELFGAPNPSAAIDVWPMQHPVLASVLWSVAILAVCVPLANSMYRRRTAD
ncbi:MAG TPA: ABC transporter permease [Microthrixaceae bacterium]|nr:ABC transporter permease [Microthrixaceae bacterium]HNI35378.1 ABC transporter permease [Microthrixaceae bacterium]